MGLAKKYKELTDLHMVTCPHCGYEYATTRVIGRCGECKKYENYGENPKKG